MKIDGSCHCGAVAYEADADPALCGICHCTDCQTLSGSPYRVTLPVPAQNFRLLRGTPKLYVKTADSGTRRAQAFCPDCSTAIYASAPDNPPTISLRWGAIRQRAQIAPQRQIWCASAAPFATDLTDIPSAQHQS